jgi:hypothetical protein
MSQLCLEISHTNSAATDVQFYLEGSHDKTTWHREQGASLSSGTYTLSDISYVKAVSADDQWLVNIPVNYDAIRLVFSGTSAAAADTVTVVARLQT